MISILYKVSPANQCREKFPSLIRTFKFPWHATKLYTVADRNAIQRATFRLLQILTDALSDRNTVGLDQRLHLELLFAGIRCPVFNERMKRALFFAAQSNGIRTVDGPSFMLWPFDTVMRKPLANDHAVAVSCSLILADIENSSFPY
jgi:hypothetical protein